MVHIAIMRKDWRLTQKLLDGRKTIESRWYKNRAAPWGKITAGDTIYFKDSGEPVTIRATVKRVMQVSNLTSKKVHELLHTYGLADGLIQSDIPAFYERFKDKRYCLLIFLRDIQPVSPFTIDKKGYGAMSAWLTVPEIGSVRRPPDSF